MKSLFYGALALDDIDLPSLSMRDVPGGYGVYGTLAASIFCDVGLLSVLGADFPKRFLKTMEKRGVNTSLVQKSKKPSFRWEAKYSHENSKIVTINREFNSFKDFDPKKLKGLSAVKAVFVSKNDPVVQKQILDAVPKKAIKIIETERNWITNQRKDVLKAMKDVDIILINEREMRLLVKEDFSIPLMVEKLMLLGPKVVILKRGEQGLVMYGKYGTMIVPCYPLTYAVDSVGVGSSLAGALVGILGCMEELNAKNLKTALILASTVSSFVVEDYGTGVLEELTINEVINRASRYLGQLPSMYDLRSEKVERKG
jgi:sugar/nucleoside kinase (ribokinase family)